MIYKGKTHTIPMRWYVVFLGLMLVLSVAHAYGIRIVNKDLEISGGDVNVYGGGGICLSGDCLLSWTTAPLQIVSNALGLSYLEQNGLGVSGGALYVKAGTGLGYDTSGNIRVLYGSSGGTAVEGNTQISIVAGQGLSGGGTITLGAGGSVELNITYPHMSCPSGALRGFDLSTGTPTCISVDENASDDVVDSDLNVFNNLIWDIRQKSTWYPLGASDVECTDCVSLGTETTGQYVRAINAGGGVTVNSSGTEALTVTIAHADTSSATSVSNTGGNVIQSLAVDEFGHVTEMNSVDLDARYVPLTRRIDTTAPLTGGGSLNSDLTLGLNIGTGLKISGNKLEMNVTSDISCSSGQALVRVNPSTGAYTCVAIDTNADDDITGSGTSPYIPYWTGSNSLGTTNIYYDSTNGRVGIGTSSPTEKLDVNGNITASGTVSGATVYSGGSPVLTTATTFSGDVSGTYNNITVSGIKGHALPSLATGALYWNGSSWTFQTVDTDPSDDLTTSTNFDGDVNGPYNNLQLKPGVVGTTELADNAVTSAKIKDGTITNADIAGGTVFVTAGDGSTTFNITNSNKTLTIAAGTGISVSVDTTNHKITITNTGDTNPGDDITGSGSANYVPKFTAARTIGTSQIYDDGTNVGIGTSSPTEKLDVNGNIKASGTISGASMKTGVVYDSAGNKRIEFDASGNIIVYVG